MYQSVVDYKFEKKKKKDLSITIGWKALIYSYENGYNHLKREI